MGTDTVEFTVQLADGIQSNTQIQLDLVVDNGLFLQRDTLTKIVISGAPASLFTETFDTANNWTDGWSLTTEDFVSPNNSWTDSPFGNYASNTYNVSETQEYISIPDNATNPVLAFDAKWNIETGYDWVQISAVEISGQEIPLCGQYSHTGTQNQPPGIPIWDGAQAQWIHESLNLEDFKGKDIKIRMTLVSDGFVEEDGFYMDDMAVTYTDTTVSSVLPTLLDENEYTLLPNPAKDFVALTVKNNGHASAEQWFMLSNSLGQIVLQQKFTGNTKMNIGSLTPGVYTWRVGESRLQKIVIR
jgi:bacillopeptidase F (M6 metalloprotease family)